MKAACIESTDAGSGLVIRDVDEPVAGPDDLLVQVRASALNRADLRHASSHFASSEGSRGPAIGGLEMAGEVIARGSDVDTFAVGDRVMAMTGGSWAERVAVDWRLASPVPFGFDWCQAAATPISFMTSFDALSTAAGLAAGESVLVQGASSSAGIATVQLALTMGAGQVIGTSTTPWKLRNLTELGCHALNPQNVDIAEAVHAITDRCGADIVIDIVGQGAVQTNIDAAAVRGRIVCLGRLAGTQGTLNLDEFSRKRIHMIGVTFRTRSLTERFEVIRGFREQVIPQLEARSIRPIVDRSFPLTEVEQAETYMKSGQGFGKVILAVDTR
jgi:NADPH:quinone reductase